MEKQRSQIQSNNINYHLYHSVTEHKNNAVSTLTALS